MGIPVAELNYIFDTYGHPGYWGLVQLATSEAYQNASDDDVFNAFIQHPTPTTSYFFREDSLRVVAETVAPRIAPTGRPLEVRHVGGGRGQEAYSFGALLAGNDIAFNSTSVDVNPDLLPTPGTVPTFTYHLDPAAHLNNKAAAQKYVRPFFTVQQVDPKTEKSPRVTHLVTPKAPLTKYVEFVQHDLIAGPPPGNPDIVLAHNIMYHYPWNTRDTLLQHALGGMTKGVVALEASGNHKPVRDYKDWIASLERFGLTPCRQLRGIASLALRQRIFSYDAAKVAQPLRTRKNTLGPK